MIFFYLDLKYLFKKMVKSFDYWKQFKPIEKYWHFTNAILLTMIGISSFVLNMLVLFYLFK